MQAVKSFDAALSLDPSNWEAAFTKAALMSHYPAELNQGQAVIDQFTQLINQQEAQPSQPQFAQTYVLLATNTRSSVATIMPWQPGSPAPPCFQAIQRSRKDWPNQPVNDGP